MLCGWGVRAGGPRSLTPGGFVLVLVFLGLPGLEPGGFVLVLVFLGLPGLEPGGFVLVLVFLGLPGLEPGGFCFGSGLPWPAGKSKHSSLPRLRPFGNPVVRPLPGMGPGEDREPGGRNPIVRTAFRRTPSLFRHHVI